jgi:hypothetical protein
MLRTGGHDVVEIVLGEEHALGPQVPHLEARDQHGLEQPLLALAPIN